MTPKAVWCLLLVVHCYARSINIGVMYSGSGIFKAYGDTVPLNVEMWTSHQLNHQNGIANTGIYPNIIYANVKSNITLTAILTKDLILNQNVQVLIAPEAFLTGIVAAIASPYRVPVIAGMSASTDVFLKADGSRKFPNLFGCMTPSLKYFDTLLQLAKIREMSRVAIIWLNGSPDNDVCNGAVQYSKIIGLTMVAKRAVSATASEQEWADAIYNISSYNADTLIVCNRLACAPTLAALSETGYTPKILAMFECAASVSQIKEAVGSRAKHFVTPVQWDNRLRGKQFSDTVQRPFANMFLPSGNLTSAQVFFKNLTSKIYSGQPLTSLIAPQMATLYQLSYAIYDCNCTTCAGITKSLARVNMPSFFGKIGMDDFGQNDAKDILLVQIDNDYVPQIIAPLDSATMNPNFPIPSWAEREFPTSSKDGAFDAILAIAIVFSLLALAAIAFILFNRNTKTIRATSYLFSVCTLVGYIIAMFSPLVWTLHDSAVSCGARIPLYVLAFTVTMMPLIAKTIRIALIFQEKTIRIRKLRDSDVAVYALVGSIPLIICCIIWVGAGSIELSTITADPLRPLYTHYECVFTSPGSQNLVIAMLVLGCLTLVASSIVAFYARHAQIEFNDASSIKWSVSIFTVLIGLTITVSYLFNESDRRAVFILRSLCIQVSFTCSMIILFFDRFINTYLERTGQLRVSGSNNNGTVLGTQYNVRKASNEEMLAQPPHATFKSSNLSPNSKDAVSTLSPVRTAFTH